MARLWSLPAHEADPLARREHRRGSRHKEMRVVVRAHAGLTLFSALDLHAVEAVLVVRGARSAARPSARPDARGSSALGCTACGSHGRRTAACAAVVGLGLAPRGLDEVASRVALEKDAKGGLVRLEGAVGLRHTMDTQACGCRCERAAGTSSGTERVS